MAHQPQQHNKTEAHSYRTVPRDQYGGCTAIQFESTGFFRLEKTDRWWLVTPEGNAYLSFGLNHVEHRHLLHAYNRTHWANEFDIAADADDIAFQPGFERKVQADMQALGITTLGIHSPTDSYTERFFNDVVDVRMVDICHYQTPTEADFRDVFSDEFVQHCEQLAARWVAPQKDDPRVLGYALTDCPILTEAESWAHGYNIYGWDRPQVPTWPRVLRNLGEESAGKRAYVSKMRDIYDDTIDEFNRTYATDFVTFESLQQARDWRPRAELDNQLEARDNAEFLLQVIDRCFAVEVVAIRKHDPNHLIFGDKFQGNRLGLTIPPAHIALWAKHFDLIYFQQYGLWTEIEHVLEQFRRYGGGKPIYMGDSSVNVPKENLPDPFGPRISNQSIRAEAFRELFYSSFARDDFVGWDWCGWMDQWGDEPANMQARVPRHAGIQDPFGHFDQPIADAMKAFSAEMYDIATIKQNR